MWMPLYLDSAVRQTLALQKFELSMDLMVDMELDSVVDKWIDLAIKKEGGVKKVHFNIIKLTSRKDDFRQWFSMPQTIFGARALTTLVLSNCVFKLHDTQQPYHSKDTIKFHFLRKLSVTCVRMDYHTVRELISSCPLMEEIILLHCPVFKNLHVFGLHKLKELVLEVSRDDHLERVDIETPSLQTQFIDFILWGYTQPCTINMDACHDLKRLDFAFSVDTGFPFHKLYSNFSSLVTLNIAFCSWINRELISSCPLMEEIILIRCAGFNNLHIFGLDKLKQVVLLLPPAAQLEKIHIEAPTLQSLSIDSASRSMNLCTIDVEECHHLKTLSIEAELITRHFDKLLSSFPFLTELHIACKWIGRLTISSRNLRRLKLHKCNKLVEV